LGKTGGVSYQYKGETFYTVTPIPYYYKRRALLLALIEPLIANATVKDVCDFGCGDGWYIQYFGNRYPAKKYYGLDISRSMLECAKRASPFATLRHGDRIDFANHFDLIYSIAVLQHVPDDVIKKLFANINETLCTKGRFVFFEATGVKRTEGETWYRRTTYEYARFAEDAGFEIEQRQLIAFPFHNLFERKIAPYYKRFIVRGFDSNERSINANKSVLFKFLSLLFLNATKEPLRADDGMIDGNTLYISRKI